MRKMLFGFMVIGALVGYQVASSGPAAAQGKKKTAAGVVEIGEGKDGKFRFFVRDGDGKLLAQSNLAGYPTAKAAEAGIDNLKSVLTTAKIAVLPKKDAKKAKDDEK